MIKARNTSMSRKRRVIQMPIFCYQGFDYLIMGLNTSAFAQGVIRMKIKEIIKKQLLQAVKVKPDIKGDVIILLKHL